MQSPMELNLFCHRMILNLFSRMLPPKFRFLVQLEQFPLVLVCHWLFLGPHLRIFPVVFPDREDSSLSGFSLVLSGLDLLSERVALPLDRAKTRNKYGMCCAMMP